MSFSVRIRYSTSSTLYSVPLYLANSTLSPALTCIGTRRPLSSRRPAPTARTVPSIGRSLLAVSGRKMPPLVFSSRSAGLITTRSASGRMRKSAAIVVVPPFLYERFLSRCYNGWHGLRTDGRRVLAAWGPGRADEREQE